MKKIDYFEGIKDHFSSLETQTIEVPEWGLVGEKAMYCKPFNMREKAKIFKGATNTDLNVLIDVIIEKALTKEDGKNVQCYSCFGFQNKSRYKYNCRSCNKNYGYRKCRFPRR